MIMTKKIYEHWATAPLVVGTGAAFGSIIGSRLYHEYKKMKQDAKNRRDNQKDAKEQTERGQRREIDHSKDVFYYNSKTNKLETK